MLVLWTSPYTPDKDLRNAVQAHLEREYKNDNLDQLQAVLRRGDEVEIEEAAAAHLNVTATIETIRARGALIPALSKHGVKVYVRYRIKVGDEILAPLERYIDRNSGV